MGDFRNSWKQIKRQNVECLQEVIGNMKKLEKDILEKRRIAIDQVLPYNKAINARVEYICKTICKVFNTHLKNWEYPNDTNSFDDAVYGNSISVYIYCGKYFSEMDIFDKNNKLWCLGDSFPERWLYEDFEAELKDGRQKYIKKEEARKLKVAKSKETKQKNRKDLVASAKAKLLPEEIAALLGKNA
jgi:hypothetical protein